MRQNTDKRALYGRKGVKTLSLYILTKDNLTYEFFLFSGGGIATTMLVTFHLRTRRCAIVFYLWNWAKIDGSTNFFYAAKLDPKLGNIRRHTEPESKEPRYNCHQNMIKLPDSFPTQTKMSFSVMFLRNFGTPCR